LWVRYVFVTNDCSNFYIKIRSGSANAILNVIIRSRQDYLNSIRINRGSLSCCCGCDYGRVFEFIFIKIQFFPNYLKVSSVYPSAYRQCVWATAIFWYVYICYFYHSIILNHGVVVVFVLVVVVVGTAVVVVVVLVVIMRQSQPPLEIYGPPHISCIDGLYSLPFIQKQSCVVCVILIILYIVF